MWAMKMAGFKNLQLKLLICFMFYLLHVVQATSTPSPSTNHSERYEKHANDVLSSASVSMHHIWNRRRDIFLSMAKSRGYNLNNPGHILREIDKDYRTIVHNLAVNLCTIPIVELRNQTLRRQVKLLSKLQLFGLSNTDYDKAKSKLQKMKDVFTTRLVCPAGRSQDSCTSRLNMVPGIQKEIVRTKRLDELNYYWIKWREEITSIHNNKRVFNDYIALLRKAAALNGHVTPSRTWYLGYETENFQKELEDVLWEIMPLYRQLHAYLRHNARQVYGQRLTDSDGGIPFPVIEQMMLEAWFLPTILATPYPKQQLPSVQARLEERLVQSDRIFKRAAEYFESLGLNKMSKTFYDNYTRRMNLGEGGADCHSEVFYFPPEIGLRYCTELDYKKLMQMHGHMAELQYNLYKLKLPFGLDREPCPGFGAAIAETAVLASGTPRHLHVLNVLAEHTLSPENAMNRLFRMAVHTILAIPQYFVNDKYLVDVLDGRIGEKDLNCGYWRLQYKYAGVIAPNRRNNKQFDVDHKFYKGLYPERSNTIKFLSEVLGLQLYRSFCLTSNQYRPGNINYPLHNCDYYNNTRTGDVIKEMMKLGATKHWRDVLMIATGERKLSGVGVMEYFAPLFTWLKVQNKRMGLDIGWDSEIKCYDN